MIDGGRSSAEGVAERPSAWVICMLAEDMENARVGDMRGGQPGREHEGRLGRGAHKNRDDIQGSVKLLRALPLPGRWCVLHMADNTS